MASQVREHIRDWSKSGVARGVCLVAAVVGSTLLVVLVLLWLGVDVPTTPATRAASLAILGGVLLLVILDLLQTVRTRRTRRKLREGFANRKPDTRHDGGNADF